jgi:hypothetical protein
MPMYIDPSTGSLVFQVGAAVAVTTVAFLGRARRSLRDFFRRRFTHRAE